MCIHSEDCVSLWSKRKHVCLFTLVQSITGTVLEYRKQFSSALIGLFVLSQSRLVKNKRLTFLCAALKTDQFDTIGLQVWLMLSQLQKMHVETALTVLEHLAKICTVAKNIWY